MFQVLQRNPAFRRLWLAQVVTQAGDWLNRMAVLALIAHLGGADAVQVAVDIADGRIDLRQGYGKGLGHGDGMGLLSI